MLGTVLFPIGIVGLAGDDLFRELLICGADGADFKAVLGLLGSDCAGRSGDKEIPLLGFYPCNGILGNFDSAFRYKNRNFVVNQKFLSNFITVSRLSMSLYISDSKNLPPRTFFRYPSFNSMAIKAG